METHATQLRTGKELATYVLWLLVGGLVGTLILFLVAFLILGTKRVSGEAAAIAFWPALVVATYLRLKRRGLTARYLCLDLGDKTPAFLGTGLVLGASFIALTFLILELTNNVASVTHPMTSTLLLTVAVGFASTFVQSGTEELVFRGYALQLLAERGKLLAMLVTAAVFSALHIGQGVNPLGWLNIFLFWVFAAQLVFTAKSLWLPIGFHAAWNFAQMRIFGFPLYGHSESGLLQVTNQTPGIVTGGSYGPEGSIIITALLLVAIVLLVLREKANQG